MSKLLYGCALTIAAALAGSGCANAQTAQNAQPVTVASANPDEVVATVGDKKFTLKDVEARWQQDDPAERARVTQLLYQHRRQSIDQLIGDYFISEAAAKAGVTKEKFLEDELMARRGAVTDAEIQKVFDENKDRVGTQSVEQLKPSITQFILRNRDAQNVAILIDELRKAGPAVNVSLDPPRYQVALADHDPARGPENAPVTIVEFSEYQCPFCGRVTPTLKALEQKYAGKVRVVFKDFPLPNHLQAAKAAEAAHCAGDQGKYWELHDRLFANQQQLQIADLKKHAAAIGLDQAKFDQCLDAGTHAADVQADVDLGAEMGVQSTPTLYINGRIVTGAQPAAVFEQIIDDELARRGGK
ncbi:MAG TPA: thioredoxin domain-containing protein [Vicinamibacterales bacterium]|nr:thioredoxin domain-containing protein [Vicinamibacterales bacterium]